MSWQSSHGGGQPSSSWETSDQAPYRSHGKSADEDGDGGNAWGGNSHGKRWGDKGWNDGKRWDSKGGYTRWQDRSRGASSQSWDEQGSSSQSWDDQGWKKTVNALSLEPGSRAGQILVPEGPQSLAGWLRQDLVLELAGLQWRDPNLECGPSLGL